MNRIYINLFIYLHEHDVHDGGPSRCPRGAASLAAKLLRAEDLVRGTERHKCRIYFAQV